MAFTATRSGECFDCNKAYKEGDTLKPNGHKTKAGKDYYCPDGDACQGAQKFDDGMAHHIAKSMKDATTGHDMPLVTPPDPTSRELKNQIAKLDQVFKDYHIDALSMISSYINVLETCEAIGITHPATIGMILNNVVRNRQG